MKRKKLLLLLGCLCIATASCGTKRDVIEESFYEEEIGTEEMSPSNISLQKKITFAKEFFWEFKKDSEWVWIEDCNGDGREDVIISQYLSQNLNEYRIYTVTDDLQIAEIGANIIGKNIFVKEGTVLCEGYDNSTATYFTTVWNWNEELNHFERENE